MKLRLPRRRLARAAIYLVSFLLILLAIDLVLVRVRRTIHPRFDTTRIVSPTTPDGSIDYLMAVENYFARGVTPQNNAAIPILQALGPAALPKNQPRDGITDRLGMAHLPDTGDYYITYRQYFTQHPAHDIDPTQPLPDTITLKPEMTQWIEANQKPLALFTEASKRSRFFIPFNGGNRASLLISVLLPQVGLLNDARWALLTRALIRLNAGDSAGFVQDIATSHRLARLMAHDSTIISRLVGVAMERSTCRLERYGIANGKLSPQQLRDMLADLNTMDDLPMMSDCVDFGERFMALDVMQYLSKSNAQDQAHLVNGILSQSVPVIPTAAFWFWPIPYDECLQDLNHFYDEQLVIMRKPTYSMQFEAWNLFDQELAKNAPSTPVARFISPKWPAQLLIPGLKTCTLKVDVARTEGELTQVSLALALFKHDHHVYPAALSELTPQ